MPVPHPIPYQGSKRNLASAIVDYFPPNVERLIEPFAGSAAVTLAAAYHGKAHQFLLNDINAPLINLWRSIIHEPETLSKRYEELWLAQLGRERRFYNLVRHRFNRSSRPYYLLYLLARCVKASVRYNADGEFNQSPDNRRKGRHPDAMRHDLLGAAALLQNSSVLMSADYYHALEDANPQDIIYLDPPYQGVSGSRDPRYFQSVSTDDFMETIEKLNRRNISFIVSYDGRTGSKTFGVSLPQALELTRIELDAGRSSQATLLGRSDRTYESLYLSPALIRRLESSLVESHQQPQQMILFGDVP